MANQKFDHPVTVLVDAAGGQETINDATGCMDFLLKRWRGKRGDKHRAALQACSDMNSGTGSVSSARKAFVVAAKQGGILVTS
jgi:hypothetical protein